MKNKVRAIGLLVLLSAFTFNAIAADAPLDQEGLYTESERLYLKNDSTGAIATLAKFFAQPASQSTPRTRIRGYNLRGLIYFQTRNLQGAVQDFEAAVQLANRSLDQSDSLLHLTRYNLGNALFQMNKPQEAFDILQAVNAEALDQDTRMRFHHLYGNVFAAREQHLDSMLQYLYAANLAKDVAARDTFLQKALNTSKNIYLKDPKADLERISALSFPGSSPAGVAVKVLMARGYMYSGNPSEAESLLKDALASAEPTHPLRAKAEDMLADLGKITEVKPNAVGVLLPLSGKFAKFGRLCLNAIMMAYGVYEDMPDAHNKSGVRLVIRDSGESAETAQEKFEELVQEEKVIAVIGPLLSKQFPAVARRAQEFGVPLFSLSQRIEGSQLGSYVFPIALSPNQQIELIVNHAMQKNGYKRFAVLAPSDSFGNEYVQLFWDAVEKNGGQVVGIERYEPRATDFRDEIKRLLGLEYLGARKTELEDLKRRGDRYAATLKVKGKLRQRLMKAYEAQAVVDFDAIFIPDDPATIGQIAPAFAVQDVANIPMLGINTWNTAEIVQRAGRYLQKSLFVDGFFASSQNPKTTEFLQNYTKHFQTMPGTIEVQAYDAGKILMAAIGEGRPKTRAKLRDQLLSQEKFAGISGDFLFTPGGVQRGAHLLTVKGNSIVEISSEESAQN
jgi:ABC-type branched-subunit amino acid transport system substrate-binding protein